MKNKLKLIYLFIILLICSCNSKINENLGVYTYEKGNYLGLYSVYLKKDSSFVFVNKSGLKYDVFYGKWEQINKKELILETNNFQCQPNKYPAKTHFNLPEIDTFYIVNKNKIKCNNIILKRPPFLIEKILDLLGQDDYERFFSSYTEKD